MIAVVFQNQFKRIALSWADGLDRSMPMLFDVVGNKSLVRLAVSGLVLAENGSCVMCFRNPLTGQVGSVHVQSDGKLMDFDGNILLLDRGIDIARYKVLPIPALWRVVWAGLSNGLAFAIGTHDSGKPLLYWGLANTVLQQARNPSWWKSEDEETSGVRWDATRLLTFRAGGVSYGRCPVSQLDPDEYLTAMQPTGLYLRVTP